MYLSVFDLSTGEWLPAVSGIVLALILGTVLIAVWLQQRRKVRESGIKEGREPEMGNEGAGLEPGADFGLNEGMEAGKESERQEVEVGLVSVIELPVEVDTPYKGLLWMKDKYEQYREESDMKLGQWKEAVEEKNRQIVVLREGMVQEKHMAVAALEQELDVSREKIADLTAKLADSVRLLGEMQKTLGTGLNAEDPDALAINQATVQVSGEVSGEGKL